MKKTQNIIKLLYTIILTSLTICSFGQNFCSKCDKLTNENKKASLDFSLTKVECYITYNCYEKWMKILDSLIKLYPDSGKLLLSKCWYINRENPIDTSISCDYLRQCIKLNYMTGYSNYLIGMIYYNYYLNYESNKTIIQFPLNNKLSMLNEAEDYFLQAVRLDKKIVPGYYEQIYNIRKKKAELLGDSVSSFMYTNKFDTLLIIGEIRDCGEFGGHYEYIKCYHSQVNIVAVFSQDKQECIGGMEPDKPSYSNYKKGEQEVSQETFKIFLNKFNELTDRYDISKGVSNAPTTFYILYNSNVYYKFDGIGRTDFFTKFRDSIFR